MDEQATGKNPYLIALGRAWDAYGRDTKAEQIDGTGFVKPFYGIERSFKAYSPNFGSQVVVKFATGSLAQTSRAAGYTVRVLATKDGAEEKVYSASFNPQENAKTDDYKVKAIGGGSGQPIFFDTPADKAEIDNGTAIEYTHGGKKMWAKQFGLTPAPDLNGVRSGDTGLFTSKPITLKKGVTDYKVQITPDFDQNNGVAENFKDHHLQSLQRNPRHFVTPLFSDFNIDQKTDLTAKELLRAQVEALKAKRAEYIADKSTPSIAKLDAAIELAEKALGPEDAKPAAEGTKPAAEIIKPAAEYKALGKSIDTAKKQLIDIKEALAAVNAEKEKKTAEIDKATGALDADKAEAKKAAEAAAEKAIAAIKNVAEKESLPKTTEDGVNAIKAITVSNKDALTAKVADDAAFRQTPSYVNADEHNFLNSDGTPNTDKNKKAPEHVAAYQKALEEAQKVLDNPTATQAQVDKALADLNKTRKDIEDNYATDLEPLKTSVNTNGGVDHSEPIYVNATPEEQQAYDKAKQAADDLLKDPKATQTQVNNAKKALDDTKAALDKHPTDKTKLSAQFNASVDSNPDSPSVFYKNAKDPAYQPPEGVDKEAAKGYADAYDKALDAAKKALAAPKASQQQVDAALEALKAAEDNLHKLSSDPTDLVRAHEETLSADQLPAFKNLQEKAKKEGADSQAAKDLAAYKDALDKASNLLLQFAGPTNQHPAQKDIEAAKAALKAARDLIDPYATDTRALQNAANQEASVKASPAYANAKAAAYLGKDGKPDAEKNKQAKNAKDAYDKALEKALEVLGNPKATQAEVDAATDALKDAEDALAPFATDASKLAAQVAGATSFEESAQFVNALAAKDGEKENADVAAYKNALRDAKATLANPKATQVEVDKALAALKAAEDKIVKNYPTDPSKLQREADKAAELQKGHDFAAALKNASTKDSAKAYQDALAAAKTVLANKNATQADVDRALNALKAAGAALKKAEENPGADQGAATASTEGSHQAGTTADTAAPKAQHVVRTIKTNATELPATGSAAAMLLIISCALIGAGALAIRRQKGN